jgi:hypothetical protein
MSNDISLDPDNDGDESPDDVEAAWSLEIEKRLREIDSGKVKPVPWEEARR